MGTSWSQSGLWQVVVTKDEIRDAVRGYESWQKAQDELEAPLFVQRSLPSSGTLLERVGGPDHVKRIVETYCRRLFADDELSSFLEDTNITTLRAKMSAFLIWLLNPTEKTNTSRHLRSAHLRLIKQRSFTTEHFSAGLVLLEGACRSNGLPEALVQEFMTRVRPYQKITFTPLTDRDAEDERRWALKEQLSRAPFGVSPTQQQLSSNPSTTPAVSPYRPPPPPREQTPRPAQQTQSQQQQLLPQPLSISDSDPGGPSQLSQLPSPNSTAATASPTATSRPNSVRSQNDTTSDTATATVTSTGKHLPQIATTTATPTDLKVGESADGGNSGDGAAGAAAAGELSNGALTGGNGGGDDNGEGKDNIPFRGPPYSVSSWQSGSRLLQPSMTAPNLPPVWEAGGSALVPFPPPPPPLPLRLISAATPPEGSRGTGRGAGGDVAGGVESQLVPLLPPSRTGLQPVPQRKLPQPPLPPPPTPLLFGLRSVTP